MIFAKSADRAMQKLHKDTQLRIIRKIEFYASQDAPLDFAETLSDSRLGAYRFRVGDMRIIFDINRDMIVVLKVGYRKDVYQ